MPGNSFGKALVVTTFGESHGEAIGVVIDGFPAMIDISLEDIQKEMDRRKPGQSLVTTPRKESDKVNIVSGVFKGKTTGTPITMIIYNEDAKSDAYSKIQDVFRPGHADYSYFKKYGIRDHRGGGRSSGRETACRLAAGALAKKILSQERINITAYTLSAAGLTCKTIDFNVIEKNIMRAADMRAAQEMTKSIEELCVKGDSAGGIIECVVRGMPAGLGEPVFDKIDADIAKAVLSIGGVKGIEFGAGFRVAKMLGSENNDSLGKEGFLSNNSGGTLGGISNGQDIIFRLAVKPTPSIRKTQKSIDKNGNETELKIGGRHDPCLTPRIVPVVESMVALVLADHILRQRSQLNK